MVLLTCIHWFNPACRYAVADLKIWDEYHCDYIVCQHRHIRRSSYCETLYAMYELGERRKSQFVPGFCEEKSDLRKRLEQMKRYEPKTKKNRRMAWTAAILFTAVGIVTALGTSAGVAYAYEKAAEIIRVCDEGEGNDKANGLKEHIRIPSEGTKGTDMIQSEAGLLALGSFECSIKNQAYFLSLCELAQGDQLTVSVGIAPADAYIKVGIAQPDGTWRYVCSCGEIDHTFEITQTGGHQIFIWNEGDAEVKVAGYYLAD